ncbi:MAG: methyltransferase [Gammaproteobacteria bacterium]
MTSCTRQVVMGFDNKPYRTPEKYDRLTEPGVNEALANTEKRHTAHTEPVLVRLKGFELYVDPAVFNPAFSNIGDLLSDNQNVQPGEIVLDMGTGTGFQALVASRYAALVVATDRQPEAVACARKNVRLNKLEQRIDVRQGDLFAALGRERFDRVLFNVPFVPWKPETPWQDANSDLEHRSLTAFVEGLSDRLQAGACAVITFSDAGDIPYLHHLCEANGYAHRVVAQRAVEGVGYFVYELRSLAA